VLGALADGVDVLGAGLHPVVHHDPSLGLDAGLTYHLHVRTDTGADYDFPKSYGTSTELTGSPEAALYIFIAFYVVCCAICWWQYYRRNADYPC
jgi:hypothetical protein